MFYYLDYKSSMATDTESICRAGGIIFDTDRTHILLVLNRLSHSKNENKWGLPKGHLIQEEFCQPHIGARREILEETGIFHPINKDDNHIIIYDTIYFIIQLNRYFNTYFEPRDKKEIHEVRWVKIKDAKKLNTNRGLSLFLRQIKT
jgi:8-oxo-dGTP pyrophosphatase MutT (NUDIX family)|tara:strand:- start:341 stop:781 length:441 start_codon:yes stop_codon:yes gene_type:complete